LTTVVVMTPQSGYATPGDDPTIGSAERQVEELYHEAEEASERYNQIHVELRQTRGQLDALREDVGTQRAQVRTLRDELGSIVAAQAQSTPGGATSQLLSSGDPEALLAGLAAVQAYSSSQADQVALFEAHSAELRLRERQLQAQVDAIAAAKADLAAEKATIEEKSQQAEELLAELEAEAAAKAEAKAAAEAEAAAEADAAAEAAAERNQPEVSRGGDRPPTQPSTQPQPPTPNVAASGRAQVAIDFALAQLGDAYVYGAAGPDAYDCSGLTMRAWGAAGVSLPHASSVQLGMGTPVSTSAMQPGDLVFYYSPVSHVGLYLGNGKVVHAPNPSRSVEVVPVSSMPITAVRRVG